MVGKKSLSNLGRRGGEDEEKKEKTWSSLAWLSAQIGAFYESELELGYVSGILLTLTFLPCFPHCPSGSLCHYLRLHSSVLPEYLMKIPCLEIIAFKPLSPT